jgi:hypothetical protein
LGAAIVEPPRAATTITAAPVYAYAAPAALQYSSQPLHAAAAQPALMMTAAAAAPYYYSAPAAAAPGYVYAPQQAAAVQQPPLYISSIGPMPIYDGAAVAQGGALVG